MEIAETIAFGSSILQKFKTILCVTSGHKTLVVKWLIECSASHQGLVSGDTFLAPKSPTFHTADRYAAF